MTSDAGHIIMQQRGEGKHKEDYDCGQVGEQETGGKKEKRQVKGKMQMKESKFIAHKASRLYPLVLILKFLWRLGRELQVKNVR
jgi:hypothetical protein